MDDTQQQAAQPTDVTAASMGDVAGMTPPPAPVMPEPSVPAAGAEATPAPTGGEEELQYAEDILNEILDSLDRIEARLDALEKKG